MVVGKKKKRKDCHLYISKFPGICSLFLKYDSQVVLNINMQTYGVSFEQKINHSIILQISEPSFLFQ